RPVVGVKDFHVRLRLGPVRVHVQPAGGGGGLNPAVGGDRPGLVHVPVNRPAQLDGAVFGVRVVGIDPVRIIHRATEVHGPVELLVYGYGGRAVGRGVGMDVDGPGHAGGVIDSRTVVHARGGVVVGPDVGQ